MKAGLYLQSWAHHLPSKGNDMCGSTPDVVRRDPVAEKLEADRKATEAANADTAKRKSALRNSSLLATAGKRAGLIDEGVSNVLERGKKTLGA